MVDVNKVKDDLIHLSREMRKIGFSNSYVNKFLTDTIEEVKNETKT